MTDAEPTPAQPDGQQATPAPNELTPAWTPPAPNNDLMAEVQKGNTAPPHPHRKS